jgi:hypothetical protein
MSKEATRNSSTTEKPRCRSPRRLVDWLNPDGQKKVLVIRYADDMIVGFQHQHDAELFLHDLKERLAKFALAVHPNKTHLIEFGRFAAERRANRGEPKPETFDFLGFTHICDTKRKGQGFQLRRKTKRKRKQALLNEIAAEVRRIRHAPIEEQGGWLAGICVAGPLCLLRGANQSAQRSRAPAPSQGSLVSQSPATEPKAPEVTAHERDRG